MERFIGIDVGGTKTLLCLFHHSRRVHEFFLFDTPSSSVELFSKIKSHCRFWMDCAPVAGIGIGIAGCVDSQKGVVSDSYNLFGSKTVNLRNAFSDLGVPMVFVNDAQAAAWGEFVSLKKKPGFLGVLTLGTGVGCGLVYKGCLFSGLGLASELGRSVVKGDFITSKRKRQSGGERRGVFDASERIGTLESQCNAASVVARAQIARLKVSDPMLVDALAQQGDSKAQRVLEETGNWVGIGITNLVLTLDLDQVILAGGLANSRVLVKAAQRTAKKWLLPSFSKRVSIKSSELAGFGGCMGAADLVAKKVFLEKSGAVLRPKRLHKKRKRFK